MWKSRFSRGTHDGRSPAAVAVALLMCLSLAACTAPEAPPPASTTGAEAIPPLPEPPAGDPADIGAGTYAVTGFTVPFEITVPDGWKTFGWGVMKEEAGEWGVFVNFQLPTAVPPDGCRWLGALVEFDPSPEAFADVMAAQTSSETTPPIEVDMGDYSGLEFDYGVESDVDLIHCDQGRLCLWADSGASQCTRVHGSMSERETDRALDLNGELAVIAVGQFKDVDPALTAEARAVFDSIEFAPPDQ